MRLKSCLFVPLVLTIAACRNLGDLPTSRPVGVVNVLTDSILPGAGHYATEPQAVFFNASNIILPDSRLALDSCRTDTVPGPGQVPVLNQLNAGEPILFTTDSIANVPMDTVDSSGITVYTPGHLVPFTPGSNVTFNVPGSNAANGFPPFTITAPTANALVLGPIDTSTTDSLSVTWNNGNANAGVVIEFLNATPQRVFCSFIDDGVHEVPAALVQPWKSGGNLHVHAYRWLTTFQANGTPAMLVISEFDTDKTTFP